MASKALRRYRRARHVSGLAGIALICTGSVILSGCSLWAHPDEDRAPQSTPATTAPPAGTSLGRITEKTSPRELHSPTPLNASPNQVPEATQAQVALCEDLRTQIRSALASARQAPATSIDENIVAAREAHADQRLDDLRSQYDQLGCASEKLPPDHSRVPLPPAAPGGLPH
jgi:hypothetical protein